MGSGSDAAEVAVYLRGLKARSNLSYKALARRAGVGSSTLHRYCSGEQFPADFRVVRSFAAACGANADEVRLLEQLWAVDPRNPAIAPGLVPPPASRPVSPAADRVEPPAADDRAELPAPPRTAPAEQAPPREVRAIDPEPSTATGAAEAGSVARRVWRPVAGLAVLAVLVVLLVVVVTVRRGDRPGPVAAPRDTGLLFSPACAGPISMGQHDSCVQEVQQLLTAAGTTISVDSSFGPETLRRVTAFQVLAGLPPRSVVDDDTKRALYAGRVSMRGWTPAQVEQRIRRVFPEEPDRAVAIAKCQSLLDPLWVLPNVDASRNWGVFQISDRRLQELGGTPKQAFDPEWNIWAARELWRTRGGFAANWPYCDGAFPRTPAPS